MVSTTLVPICTREHCILVVQALESSKVLRKPSVQSLDELGLLAQEQHLN